MNKIFSFLLLFSFLFLTINVSDAAINSYDKYGKKIGSYRETSSGFNSYDKNGSKSAFYRKYGHKIGSYKTNSNGTTIKYDQYGRKTGSYKQQKLLFIKSIEN